MGTLEGGGWAAAVAVVVVPPSGVPVVRHHAPMLARHPMWSRSQYVSVFNLSLLDFYPLVCLYVNCHREVIVCSVV